MPQSRSRSPRQRGCTHDRARNLYDQRPPSEGRKLVAAARLCEDCGAVFPRTETT